MFQFAIAVLIATVSTAPSGNTWFEHYEKGVRFLEQGKAPAAAAELNQALAGHQAEGLQVPARSQQYLDYTPHLYLAIAAQMQGDLVQARAQLKAAEDSGVAEKSESGRALLVAYQLLLRGGSSKTLTRPVYATYPEKQPVLSEAEFTRLRKDVMQSCDMPTDAKLEEVPWYARYELGLQLEKKADYPRALTEMIEAVSKRPNPQRKARTYGMWLVDYYPYFHIARSHVRLGNWDCARNALDISEKLSEIPAEAPEYDQFLSLQRETEKHIPAKPASR
ncbi:MAG TPA: hypothetical protein VHL58_00105 [Thermoanaerobaculia bacterium]|nr:hypothetical protein [Thermoanaerobaculia bacterium]